MSKNISMLEISQLVCTRISHDLVGNIGAVANAVELLEDEDMDFIDDIKNILKNSSLTMASRMKFFRIVFGSQSENLERLDLVKKITTDYIKTISGNHDVSVDFNISDGRFSQIAMLCSMIVADTFIRGGKIAIKQEDNKLTVSTDNNSMLKEKVFIIKEVIKGNNTENLAQYAPILYLKEILKNTEYKLKTTEDENLTLIVE